MTFLICGSTSESIALLGEPIADSGEGKVWRTNHGYLAKIYHSPTPERVQKLAVMISHPPTEPNFHLNHISFAWPKSSLKNAQGDCVGFLMPEINDAKELLDVYNPQLRKRKKLEVDWRFLHITAQNIASIIASLHANGYVLGDIKPQNILVNNRALPSIIDTDSFQIRNPKNGKIYRCPVGSPEYTPPELIDKDFYSIDQTEVHDRFRLAVIIYQLLFGGQTPFAGKWIGAGDTPEMNELIRRGLWLHAPNSLLQPVERTIPLEIVHPEVQRCFLKCFNDGHQNPHLRPTAREWLEALKVASNELNLCGRIDSHYYSQTYGKCYWCDRSTKLGIDIFPGKAIPTANPIPNASLDNLTTGEQIPSFQGHCTQKATSTPQPIPNYSPQNLTKVQKVRLWFSGIYFFLLLIMVSIQYFTNVNQKLTPSELNEIANSQIEEYINGIGISFKIDEKTKIPTITEIIKESPAASKSLEVGDQILQVDGISTSNMSATNVANLIQGDVNTRVLLSISRPGFGNIHKILVRESLINPNLDKDYVNRCSARFQLKDYSNAINDCNEAVKINSYNDEAYFLRGAIHIINGNHYQGMEDLRSAALLGNEKAKEILKEHN
ncbi:serine/threonine protein kinase with WD-40 repeats [Calothrix sp. NIES-2100]|uniref:protein kinase domain-containing protein n=1 Tax=Calothrix sp. NIES-2100 TaxID=1954172 RepID=UPI000B6168F4|nr:serine/threonine protein kinase with WD-40 repeats [Calothrix sp. NIES-2100]